MFLDGLQQNVKADYTFLTLPARKWKMRMQLSALWFVQQLQQLPENKRYFDLVICSTFVDLSVLRALLAKQKWWNPETLFHVYFHENQFSYPGQVPDPQVYQFTSINFTSALSADSLAFNSRYNLNTFLSGTRWYLKKAADMQFHEITKSIQKKARVLHPGLDFSLIDKAKKLKQKKNSPVIIWNHRWEHDKAPEHFFSVLCKLQDKKLPFQLIVLGQSFKSVPECFLIAKNKLAERIIHFGYVDSKKDYANLLTRGDIVISTANHEFFGISVIEAVRAGCYPLLPNRLSYPELFGKEYLYEEKALESRLEKIIRDGVKLDEKKAKQLTDRFQWSFLRKEYKKWLIADTFRHSEAEY